LTYLDYAVRHLEPYVEWLEHGEDLGVGGLPKNVAARHLPQHEEDAEHEI
jgi:hypothetical protein